MWGDGRSRTGGRWVTGGVGRGRQGGERDTGYGRRLSGRGRVSRGWRGPRMAGGMDAGNSEDGRCK